MVIKLILNVEWGRKLVRQKTERPVSVVVVLRRKLVRRERLDNSFGGTKDCLLIVRLLWVVIHMLVEDRRRPAGTGDI
jgi:hypothetical protein